jgi:hypothetical protein
MATRKRKVPAQHSNDEGVHGEARRNRPAVII